MTNLNILTQSLIRHLSFDIRIYLFSYRILTFFNVQTPSEFLKFGFRKFRHVNLLWRAGAWRGLRLAVGLLRPAEGGGGFLDWFFFLPPDIEFIGKGVFHERFYHIDKRLVVDFVKSQRRGEEDYRQGDKNSQEFWQ